MTIWYRHCSLIFSIGAGDGVLTSLSGSFTDFSVTLSGLVVPSDSEGFLHITGNGSTGSTDAVADCAGTATIFPPCSFCCAGAATTPELDDALAPPN